MYIHLGYVKQQINLRRYLPKHQSNIGSALKHRRKELKLTLEEGAFGICSISYLSKVENNLIIPTNKYVDLLEERYDINIDYKKDELHQQTINDIIEALFYNLSYQIDQSLKTGYTYYAKLYNLSQYIINEDFKQARISYFDLNPYIKNMQDLELSLFLYLTAIILKKEGRLKDAFSILNFYQSFKLPEKLQLLIEKEKLIIACKINNHSYILLNYEQILKTLFNKEYYEITHQIKYHYLLYLSQFKQNNSEHSLFKITSNINENNKKYLKAIYFYYNLNFDKSYYNLKEIYDLNEEFYILYLFTLNKLGKCNEIKTTLSKDIKLINKSHHLIKQYFEIKYLKEKEANLNFLRDKVLKVKEMPDHIIDLRFWYEEGIKVLKENGFYKDATYLANLIYSKEKELSYYN